MSDSLPPVAIRVVRPYASEDELLEEELETLTRTSITLVGAAPRPHGLVLRFELVLSTGACVLRGEGRVVGYKPDAHFGTGGLTLRFTRLDSKSKLLVDRAASLRDRRRPSANPTPGETSSPSLAPVRVEDDVRREDVPSAAPSGPEVPLAAISAPEIVPESVPESVPSAPPAVPDLPSSVRLTGSPDREALLERLRSRSRGMDEASIRRLLGGLAGRGGGAPD